METPSFSFLFEKWTDGYSYITPVCRKAPVNVNKLSLMLQLLFLTMFITHV